MKLPCPTSSPNHLSYIPPDHLKSINKSSEAKASIVGHLSPRATRQALNANKAVIDSFREMMKKSSPDIEKLFSAVKAEHLEVDKLEVVTLQEDFETTALEEGGVDRKLEGEEIRSMPSGQPEETLESQVNARLTQMESEMAAKPLASADGMIAIQKSKPVENPEVGLQKAIKREVGLLDIIIRFVKNVGYPQLDERSPVLGHDRNLETELPSAFTPQEYQGRQDNHALLRLKDFSTANVLKDLEKLQKSLKNQELEMGKPTAPKKPVQDVASIDKSSSNQFLSKFKSAAKKVAKFGSSILNGLKDFLGIEPKSKLEERQQIFSGSIHQKISIMTQLSGILSAEDRKKLEGELVAAALRQNQQTGG